MTSHYGVHLIPNAHKNAMNVVYALWQGEDAAASENFSQPANADGLPSTPVAYWLGGKPYSDAELLVIQNMTNNIPSASWPVQGVSGSVTLAQAQAAAAAMIVSVTTQESYSTQQAQATLASVLTSLGMKRVNYDE